MIEYPQIALSTGMKFREFEAYVFDKLDGSNLRAEWSRKRGWYKFGTRTRRFDETDEIFGEAVSLFHRTLAEDLDRRARKERWNNLVVFAEFWGPQSLGGQHVKGDAMNLTVFDAAPERGDLMGPREFMDVFGPEITPRFLGRIHWTRGFVDRVRTGEFAGPTLEGVVGKAMDRHGLILAKAKTQRWIEKIMERYGPEEGLKIVNS